MNLDQLHRDSIIFDGHSDFLYNAVNEGRRFEERSDGGHTDLPRLRAGGVSAQIFALFCLDEDRSNEGNPTVESLRQVDAFYQMQERCADQFVFAGRAADIEAAKTDGRVAGVLGLEGIEPLAGDIGLLRVYHRLGVRNVGLTWNYRNHAGDGVGVDDAGGLTDFGRLLVAECFQLGMMVDIAHLAPPGVKDVLEMTEGPVIASHANAYALCAHRRNLTDAQLDALAATGGVVCVTFVPGFITESPTEASLERLLDHIDYMVHCMGVEHVGIGSDFEGYDGVTRGLEDVTRLPALTAGLAGRGYDALAIRGILGLNLLRVFRQVVG